MPHDHGHDHRHEAGALSDRRLVWAVAINVALTFAQIVGGIIAGSLALVADALHNLNDAASLGLALFARRISRRPAHKGMTFGYSRAEVIAALINLVTLIIVGLYLVYEAIARVFAPEPIARSEEHTSELQSLMRISYAVFCLKKKNTSHSQH